MNHTGAGGNIRPTQKRGTMNGQKWSDFDKYVRGEHLNGKTVRVVIERVTVEKFFVGGAKVTKPVLWFRGTTKGLILNDGNRRTLARLFGDDVSAAIGKPITLTPVPNGDGLTIKVGAAANGNENEGNGARE
jgi:hypothetical protein